ncbi:lipoate--protein ligase family protein [Paenibacillus endoradicis]|uniref:lipoate--protein ligase family protein n=1 Tax=Paenibacillus endoradicis TaxID=2972487 RepID=UPI00215995B9|nr:lipoate--protein ligase family protein [Paenibacillus endoradicis]MCR8660232.1 lipoate--protein ligase family protein [Paenibacillus endoradicis]
MLNEQTLTWANSIQIIDRTEELTEADPLYSFALDELLCKQAHVSGASFCHLWRHPNAFILGQRDSRLPDVTSAMEWLESKDYIPVIRNSGGAAVPLDLGTINLSLIFPKATSTNTHFHQDFEKMYELICEALSFTGLSVDKGEIQGAFCPGDYDLSINGRKFCGIAQRRQLHAYSVQAFVITSGCGSARTQLVRHFYDLAAFDSSLDNYPHVTDESTGSLEELAHLGKDANRIFIDAIKRTLTQVNLTASMSLNRDKQVYSPTMLPYPETIRAVAEKLRKRYSVS